MDQRTSIRLQEDERVKVSSSDGHEIGTIIEAWLTQGAARGKLKKMIDDGEIECVHVTGFGNGDLYIPPRDLPEERDANRLALNNGRLVVNVARNDIHTKEWRERPAFTVDEKARAYAVDLYKVHQGTAWSRLQTASVVEAATLTGWYTLLSSTSPAPVHPAWVLVLGSVLLVGIGIIMGRDWSHISRCEDQAGDWVPRPQTPHYKEGDKLKRLKEAIAWANRGRVVGIGAVILLVVVNLILGVRSVISPRNGAEITTAVVLERLSAAGLPVGNIYFSARSTDPNDGYTSRAGFLHRGMGSASVETFASRESLDKRRAKLETTSKGEYRFQAGLVLLRLPHTASEEDAEAYRRALEAAVKK